MVERISKRVMRTVDVDRIDVVSVFGESDGLVWLDVDFLDFSDSSGWDLTSRSAWTIGVIGPTKRVPYR